MRLFICTLSFAIFCSAPVCAQTEQDTVVVLPEIEIRDSLRSVILRSGVARRVISAERISAWSGASVSDLLGAESFASVRQYGSSGLATVSLRGSGSEHTLITLDGVVLVDPQSGRLDLSTVPVTFLESVVVSLGAGHKSGGQGALGGTIELRSLEPTNQPFLRGTLKAGAYGRRHGGAALSRSLGPLRTLVAVDLSEYTGDFSYQDPSSFPRRSVQRTGAERSGRNVFGRIALDTPLGDWDASVWLSNTRRGVPGPSNAPPTVAEQIDQATRFRVSNAHRIKSGSVVLQFALSDISLEYLQADSRNGDVLQRSSTRSSNLMATVKRAVSRLWMLEAESSVRHERSTIRSGERQSFVTLNLLGTFDHSTIQATLGTSLAAWHDGSSSPLQLLPRAAIRFLPNGSEGLSVRVSAGRIFRPPTFNDRYWLPGGNPNLLPETGWAADVGFSVNASHDARTIGLSVSAFWSALHDKIIWHPSFVGPQIQIWTPDNVGQVIGYGGESSLDLAWRVGEVSRVEAMILYSYSRSEDRTNPITRSFGNQLRYVPQQVVKVRLSFAVHSIVVEAVGESVSKRYTSSDERFPLPGYWSLTLRARHSLNVVGGRLALQMAVENLANERIEHIRFYPTPPRHLAFSLQYTFNAIDLEAS
ncbi:MAG: TonB-dependent receptor [Bacteroidetes bacterium]|nr:TonB-dependent receptor [Bacteroidota bacterium]